MPHRGRVARIGRRLSIDEFQRPVRRGLETECGEEFPRRAPPARGVGQANFETRAGIER